MGCKPQARCCGYAELEARVQGRSQQEDLLGRLGDDIFGRPLKMNFRARGPEISKFPGSVGAAARKNRVFFRPVDFALVADAVGETRLHGQNPVFHGI